MPASEFFDPFEIPLFGPLRSRGFHHNRGNLALIFGQQTAEHVEIAIDKWNRRSRQSTRHANRLNTGKGIFSALGIDEIICRLVPIVPSVITAKKNDVSICRASSDAGSYRTGFPSPLCITHHFSARYGIDQFICQFNFERTVHRMQTSTIDLLFNSTIDNGICISQNNSAQSANPIDILIAINIDKSRAF